MGWADKGTPIKPYTDGEGSWSYRCRDTPPNSATLRRRSGSPVKFHDRTTVMSGKLWDAWPYTRSAYPESSAVSRKALT